MAKRKPTIEMKMICRDCKHEPTGEQQGAWNVTSTTCPKCGGRVEIKFDEGGK